MRYIMIAFLLVTFNIQASEEDFFSDKSSFEFKFGGWSKHSSDRLGYLDVPLNESHNGVGFEYYKAINNHENHFLGSGLWYMKDSFNNDSIQASVAYKYRLKIDYIIDSLDFNLNVGVVNRTYRTMKYERTYQGDSPNYEEEFLGYDEYRDNKISVTPLVSINMTENIQVDVSYLPEFVAKHFDSQYGLFFFRFGYKF